MKALSYLKSIPRTWMPLSIERPCQQVSNSEIVRWLKSGSVIINGKRPLPLDEVEFPITELVFFPSGKRKTTIIKEK